MSQVPPDLAVVDTMVASWLMDERPNQQADRYRELIGDPTDSAGLPVGF